MFWTPDGQREISRRHREVPGDRGEEQPETLANTHPEAEQHRRSDQDQPCLVAARGDGIPEAIPPNSNGGAAPRGPAPSRRSSGQLSAALAWSAGRVSIGMGGTLPA